MHTKMQKLFTLMSLSLIATQFMATQIQTTFASAPGSVVINEINWSGSPDSSSDEWIELYNTTNNKIDLSNWTIEDDGAPLLITEGVIPAKGFFLIEDHENSLSNIQSDIVIPLSLANSGDSLVLKNSDAQTVDTVNGNGGAWYAGSSADKSTMERKDPMLSGNEAGNWASSTSNNIGLGQSGSAILGTPKLINSAFSGEMSELDFVTADNIESGDNIEVQISSNLIEDMYAYGFDVTYDSNVLDFQDAVNGNLLNADGTNTFFQASLENGLEGKIIISEARLLNPATGIDTEGTLLTLNFTVIGDEGDSTDLVFGAESFISDSNGNLAARLNSKTITVGDNAQNLVNPVQNLSSQLSENRYALDLEWDAPVDGADDYVIQKQNTNGDFVQIAITDQLSYTDDQNILPGIDYTYRVISRKDAATSEAVEVVATETRALVGDIDRSDRVDGKDIELLARAYGSALGEGAYDIDLDTNYDGIIDGNDLINIGVNFALTF